MVADSQPSIILHVDMDAFYASVALRSRPELRGSPVIVGGFPRGVVLSATYEARALGVRSGMSSAVARRQAPRATFIDPDFDAYRAVSAAIVPVFESVTGLVEAASIDEAFLDVTGSVRRFGSATAIGEQIRATVMDEQQITCSVGIGPTKFVAKMASRSAKPDGLRAVAPGEVEGFLHPLPVRAMWGVGSPTAAKLHRLGVQSVGDLATTPPAVLRSAFGPRAGLALRHLAHGGGGAPVVVRRPERSVGSQETFGRDSDDPSVARRELLRMADRTAYRMRRQRVAGRVVTVGVRFADFRELTRSVSLDALTDVSEEIYAAALGLYDGMGVSRARIRRVGVRVSGLVDAASAVRQPRLDDPDHGWREADRAADAAVRRFGPGAVRRAVLSTRTVPAQGPAAGG